MTAPKTPEGIARAKARAEEKRRQRTPRQLEREAWEVGMHYRCSDREAIVAAGELIQTVGKVVAWARLTPAQLAQVRAVDRALRTAIGWAHGELDPWMTVSVDEEGLRELAAAVEERKAASRREALRMAHEELHRRFPGAVFAECTDDCPKPPAPPPGVIDFATKRAGILARRRRERRGEP